MNKPQWPLPRDLISDPSHNRCRNPGSCNTHHCAAHRSDNDRNHDKKTRPGKTIPSTPPHHCSNPPHHKRNEPRNHSEPDGGSRFLCTSSCRSCTKKLPDGPHPCRPCRGHNSRHKNSKQPRRLNYSTRKIFQEGTTPQRARLSERFDGETFIRKSRNESRGLGFRAKTTPPTNHLITATKNGGGSDGGGESEDSFAVFLGNHTNRRRGKSNRLHRSRRCRRIPNAPQRNRLSFTSSNKSLTSITPSFPSALEKPWSPTINNSTQIATFNRTCTRNLSSSTKHNGTGPVLDKASHGPSSVALKNLPDVIICAVNLAPARATVIAPHVRPQSWAGDRFGQPHSVAVFHSR